MNNHFTQVHFNDPNKVTGLSEIKGTILSGSEHGGLALTKPGLDGQILSCLSSAPGGLTWVTSRSDNTANAFLYNENDLIINNKDELIFEQLNSNILTFYQTDNYFQYLGKDNMYYIFNIAIHYKSNDSTYPYEITKFSINVNSIEVFSKKYGYNALDTIIDTITLQLNTNDIISFHMDMANTQTFTLKQNSIITIVNI